MKNFELNIAGYGVRFEAAGDFDLQLSKRFQNFLKDSDNPDLHIRVHNGIMVFPEDAIKVFDAPYVEEINGIRIEKKPEFWSIWQNRTELFIRASSPFTSCQSALRFSFDSGTWDLWTDNPGSDPLEYPIDSLIIYYLTVLKGDILIHASGVNSDGKGFIFSGISGKGKTTMSGLWDNHGAKVIHDDRLILRILNGSVRMYNSPVYGNDEPRESSVDGIFIINHGRENIMTPLAGSEAESLLISNCIQHNWNNKIIERLLLRVSDVCSKVPVRKLSFVPDKRLIEYILENA